MTVGFVMLAHGDMRRPLQVAAHLAAQGALVALHVDARTPLSPADASGAAAIPGLVTLPRQPTPWGSWGLAAAALDGAARLLGQDQALRHVCLISGSCVPLAPLAQLQGWLAARPRQDFIQSVQAGAADWVVDGLQAERFTLRFPFDLRSSRRFFHLATQVQRGLPARWRRQVPPGLTPCLGSQWWCLSRETLEAILADPDLPSYRRYFRGVWIPDEAFFQTLVRRHGRAVVSRSLTWAPFDNTGRPVVLYDDHLPALQRAEDGLFFARKVWTGADRIYDSLTGPEAARFAAGDGSALGRLVMQSRRAPPVTPGIVRRSTPPGPRPYTVIYGVDALFPGLAGRIGGPDGEDWLGPVFSQRRRKGVRTRGGLSRSSAVARANPSAYLANLLRDCPGHPVVTLRPGCPAEAMAVAAADPMARIVAIRGGWTIALQRDSQRSDMAFAAAQRSERWLLAPLANSASPARIHLWDLEAALAAPDEVLAALGLPPGALPLADWSGLPDFLRSMRDTGLNPSVRIEALPPCLTSCPRLAAE